MKTTERLYHRPVPTLASQARYHWRRLMRNLAWNFVLGLLTGGFIGLLGLLIWRMLARLNAGGGL